MYSPRYREEPSIGTCEEDRVLILRKLTELNVNKSPRFILYYLCVRDIGSRSVLFNSALAEHRSARCGWFPNMFQFSSFCFWEYRVRLYSLSFNKGEFQRYFEGFYWCVSLICRELLVHSVATKHKVVIETRQLISFNRRTETIVVYHL